MAYTNRSSISKANIALIYYILLLLLCIVYGTICILYQNSIYNQSMVIKSWGLLSILLLILSSFIFNKRTNSFFNAYTLYILVAYFYWLGSIFLNALNINKENSVLNMYNYESLISPVVFSVLGFGLFQLAAILYTNRRPYITNFCKTSYFTNKNYRNSILIISVILLIMSTPIYYSDLINRFIITNNSGYGALYNTMNESSSITNIIGSLKIFFVPGLYLFLTVKKESKVIRYFVIGIVLVNVIFNFIIGARSSALMFLISFLWLYHVQISPFKGIKNILLLFQSIIIMAVSVSIMQYRGTVNKNLGDFLNLLLKNVTEDNFIVTFINELGFSILPLIETMKIIPDKIDFSYGFSYLSSILAVIPSLFFGGFSFADYAALDIWLMNELGMNYGPGYSLIAETYYNFGWFGLILMMFFGGGLAIIFNNKVEGDEKLIRNVYIAILIYYLLMTARSPLLLTSRNIFYGVIIPMVLIKIVDFSKNRRKLSKSDISKRE
jgi:oligosaccharide repeat unit polymerase